MKQEKASFLANLPRFAAVLLAVGASVGYPASARATAIYDALASTVLTITDIRNLSTPGDLSMLTIMGDASIFDEDEFALGMAVADSTGIADVVAVDPAALGVGEGLSLAATAMGSADPVGQADSFVFIDGFIDIFNGSTTDIFEIDIEVTFDLSALVTIDDLRFEDAFAMAFLSVSAASLGSLVDELRYPTSCLAAAWTWFLQPACRSP